MADSSVSKIINAQTTFKSKIWTHFGFYTIDGTSMLWVDIFGALHRALTHIHTGAFESRCLLVDPSISGCIRDPLIDACLQNVCLCGRSVRSVKDVYLQHVLEVLINVANQRHIC